MNSMGADSNFDEIDKHREAKDAIKGLLEILNAKYAAELRKDPNKDAEFLYSKFSPFQMCIRTEERFKLRDILALV